MPRCGCAPDPKTMGTMLRLSKHIQPSFFYFYFFYQAMTWTTRALRALKKREVNSQDDHSVHSSPNLRDLEIEPAVASETVIIHSNPIDDGSAAKDKTPDIVLESEQQKVNKCPPFAIKSWNVLKKFVWFIGPGLQVSVAYMDPGNYSTDVSGGAQFEYKMLFVILLSTIIALYLQTLSIRLGSVTGRDLAQACHENLPKYLSWFIWILAEGAILATDVAEVAGTAIALKILIKVPLIAGVFITIVDVLLIMMAYGRENGMRALRFIEIAVTVLLLTVVICFCVILGRIPKANVGHVLDGYVPSSVLVSSTGIYSAAGILGATVMPHSLYLGSSQAIPRVREYDIRSGYSPQERNEHIEDYKPSVYAIRSTMRYSVAELVIALVTVALFVNSAILITAGDTLFGTPDQATADLFSLNETLKQYLGNGVADLFFVALLASGLSAGVICTISGQIVSEGHIHWKTTPWIRRLVTRIITMIPCVVVVATLGQSGISQALNWSQIVLTITLPFLTAPLVYLTSLSKVMRVSTIRYDKEKLDEKATDDGEDYSNGWISTIFGACTCIFILIVNVYLLTEIGITGTI